jgi:hypothetical protein
VKLDELNMWTLMLYTIIGSLYDEKVSGFPGIHDVSNAIEDSQNWSGKISCSFDSILSKKKFKKREVKVRLDIEEKFDKVSDAVVKLLLKDLCVLADRMAAMSLAENFSYENTQGTIPKYPREKINCLSKYLIEGRRDKNIWSYFGCLELIAVRNAIEHNESKWNEESIEVIRSFSEEMKCDEKEDFIANLPKAGDRIVLGFPILFRYRAAIRTFFTETSVDLKKSKKSKDDKKAKDEKKKLGKRHHK